MQKKGGIVGTSSPAEVYIQSTSEPNLAKN